MANQTNDSGFHSRVHQGHVENFDRKLRSAGSRVELDRILQSIEFAVSRKMIDDTDKSDLNQVFQQRLGELDPHES